MSGAVRPLLWCGPDLARFEPTKPGEQRDQSHESAAGNFRATRQPLDSAVSRPTIVVRPRRCAAQERRVPARTDPPMLRFVIALTAAACLSAPAAAQVQRAFPQN